jgi:hypothetical protein
VWNTILCVTQRDKQIYTLSPFSASESPASTTIFWLDDSFVLYPELFPDPTPWLERGFSALNRAFLTSWQIFLCWKSDQRSTILFCNIAEPAPLVTYLLSDQLLHFLTGPSVLVLLIWSRDQSSSWHPWLRYSGPIRTVSLLNRHSISQMIPIEIVDSKAFIYESGRFNSRLPQRWYP